MIYVLLPLGTLRGVQFRVWKKSIKPLVVAGAMATSYFDITGSNTLECY